MPHRRRRIGRLRCPRLAVADVYADPETSAMLRSGHHRGPRL